MKLKYDKPRGKRIKKQFRDYTPVESYGEIMFPCYSKIDGALLGRSTHNTCYSVRAFRRHLRKNIYNIPAGTTVCLCNRYTGYNVMGKTKEVRNKAIDEIQQEINNVPEYIKVIVDKLIFDATTKQEAER